MLPDQPHQRDAGEEAPSTRQPLYALPFAVQLQNIFPMEIVARRFPVVPLNSPNVQLTISEVQIDSESSQAQVTLEVRVDFSDEPRPFEIFFKMVGQFAYTQEYSAEMVNSFLSQGSLSAMVPFARELLLSLCTRLQIPPIMLMLVQLASPPSITGTEEESTPQ